MGLTYRPILTQLLVTKTTRENGEKILGTYTQLGQNVKFSAAVRTCSVTGYTVKQSRLFHTMVP